MNSPLDAAQDAELSDETLMSRAHAGNSPALGEIFRRYRERLQGQAIEWLPLVTPGRRQMAEDLTGNTIYKVVKSVRRNRARWDSTKGSVWVWMQGILRNETMSFLRTKKGKERLGVDCTLRDGDGKEVSIGELAADRSPSVEDQAIHREELEKLMVVRDQLPALIRRMMEMKYDEECSHAEIAREHNTSVPTVSRRLAEGRERLQKAMTAERTGPPTKHSSLSS